MLLTNLTIREQELLIKLSSLVKEYGFMEVLSRLEQMASNNADISGKHWEIIRKNLEESILELEEWNISNMLN